MKRIIFFSCCWKALGHCWKPLGHLTNFLRIFTNFVNFGKFVKIRDFFAEVTNSRSMVCCTYFVRMCSSFHSERAWDDTAPVSYITILQHKRDFHSVLQHSVFMSFSQNRSNQIKSNQVFIYDKIRFKIDTPCDFRLTAKHFYYTLCFKTTWCRTFCNNFTSWKQKWINYNNYVQYFSPYRKNIVALPCGI